MVLTLELRQECLPLYLPCSRGQISLNSKYELTYETKICGHPAPFDSCSGG